MALLTDKYAKRMHGVVSCFDRIIVTGTLPGLCYGEGMASYLRAQGIRIFDYPRFAETLRDDLRQNAAQVAKDQGLEIEFIRSSEDFRKEDRIQEILRSRGEHPGLVHIFSAMEPCAAFEAWHDKPTGHTTLRYRQSVCLHYYFYFIDEEFGLCFLRVPTWAPFPLMFYCNGHNWLARQLQREGIASTQIDNTFVSVADPQRAQALADQFPVERLHQLLDRVAASWCSVLQRFDTRYHWSVRQLEYATDLMFRRQDDLRPLYAALVHTAIHAVKPKHVATFLGRKLHGNYEDELGNDFHTRQEGTRIKHHMGPVAIKMYDKHALVLRIETTVNDVSWFKHHRKVEHRDGTCTTQQADVKKSIYSLSVLREMLQAANRRYLKFISKLGDPTAGVRKLEKLSQPVRQLGRTYRGFNLFAEEDLRLFRALSAGEWAIRGFQNADLRRLLPEQTGPRLSRVLKRLRLHGLIKQARHSYRYSLTRFGEEVILTALKLRELVVIPSLAHLTTRPDARFYAI